jgi:hypothetical protein
MDEGEFCVLKKINETLFKVFIIILLCIALVILGFTASKFYNADYTQTALSWHMYMGALVLLLMPVHMIIKKNKIKKLAQEFINILLRKDIKHVNNKEELLENIKKCSIKEIADLFGVKLDTLVENLEKNHIVLSSEVQTLKDIAKENSKDMYQIFILILRLHVESSSPKKG